jgi:hypothetical protein
VFDPQNSKSIWNYIPIIFSLLFGYIGGLFLTFGVEYLDVLSSITNQNARLELVLFGMGMLGATLYCSSFWAVDITEAIEKPQFLPNFFDFIGYITLIIGGGITGIILYFVVTIGEKAIFIENPKMRVEAAYLISFCGGLFHFQVRRALEEFVKSIFKKREKQEDRAKESK